MITFACGACGRTIAAEVGSGSTVRCPYCKQIVTVPMDPQGNPVAPPTAPQGVDYARQLRPNRTLAIVAMVLGILGLAGTLVGCGVVLGPVAIILGIVALVKARRQPGQYGGKGFSIAAIATGGISMVAAVVFFLAIMLPPLSRARGMAGVAVCSANLGGLGRSLAVYASQYRGEHPPSLDVLVSSNLAQPSMLVCPADNGQSTGAADSSFYVRTPQTQSYIYIPGQNQASDPRNVLMYERPGIHDDGGNVLFADYHAEWVSPYSRVEQMVAETRARLSNRLQAPPLPEAVPEELPAEQAPQDPTD